MKSNPTCQKSNTTGGHVINFQQSMTKIPLLPALEWWNCYSLNPKGVSHDPYGTSIRIPMTLTHARGPMCNVLMIVPGSQTQQPPPSWLQILDYLSCAKPGSYW
ncbi:hypothetical protein Tco_1169893 [Tanacetum coccineum]